MNRVTLTHYQNNKVVGFISEDKAKSFHGMEFLAAVWGNTGGSRFAKYVLSKYLFAAKIAGKSWTI